MIRICADECSYERGERPKARTYLRGEARLIKVSGVSELLWEADARVVELLDVRLGTLGASDLFDFDDLNAFASGPVSAGHVSHWIGERAFD